MLLFLLAAGCAPPDIIDTPLSAAGYTELLLDTWIRDIAPADVSAVTVGGIPAYDLEVTAADELSVMVQGGPSGEAPVVLTVDGAAVEVGTVTYEPPVDPVFDRFVAIGASVSMGFQDGAPSQWAQRHSPPAMLAQAAGAYLPLPLFTEDLWETMTTADVGPAPDCLLNDPGGFVTTNTINAVSQMADPETGEIDYRRARVTPDVAPQNIAIGNFRLREIVHGPSSTDPSYAWLTFLAYENDSEGLGGDVGPSQLERLDALDPSIIICIDCYGNDILNGILSPDGVNLDGVTTEEVFSADLDLALEALAATGAEVFLSNLPPVDGLPRIVQAGHDPDELQVVLDRAARFNALLAEGVEEHDNIHLIDVVSFFEETSGGLQTDSLTLDFTPLGGLISYDGIHFTDIGNAIIAQLFMDAISDELGVTFPELPLASIVTRSVHSPFAVGVWGRDPAACAHDE